eukprot:scaffold14670_cov108-Isochrysis_galbana.AAC.4
MTKRLGRTRPLRRQPRCRLTRLVARRRRRVSNAVCPSGGHRVRGGVGGEGGSVRLLRKRRRRGLLGTCRRSGRLEQHGGRGEREFAAGAGFRLHSAVLTVELLPGASRRVHRRSPTSQQPVHSQVVVQVASGECRQDLGQIAQLGHLGQPLGRVDVLIEQRLHRVSREGLRHTGRQDERMQIASRGGGGRGPPRPHRNIIRRRRRSARRARH